MVLGGGLLGLYGCALLRQDGFTVHCSDPTPGRAEQAVSCGAEPGVTEQDISNNQYHLVVEVGATNQLTFLNILNTRPVGLGQQ